MNRPSVSNIRPMQKFKSAHGGPDLGAIDPSESLMMKKLKTELLDTLQSIPKILSEGPARRDLPDASEETGQPRRGGIRSGKDEAANIANTAIGEKSEHSWATNSFEGHQINNLEKDVEKLKHVIKEMKKERRQ